MGDSDELELKRLPAIRTRQIELEDKDGNVRGVLGTSDDGYAALKLVSPGGRSSIEVSMTNSGAPGITLTDMGGTPRISMDITESGQAQVGLIGSDMKPRIVITVTPEMDSVIAVKDGKGAIRDGIFLMANGTCSRLGSKV